MSLQTVSDFSLEGASIEDFGSIQTANNFGNYGNRNPKITAMYFRLSNDDKNMDDSDSIVNQRAMVTKYAEENGLTNLMEFVDDGWTGVDFHKRPGFQ